MPHKAQALLSPGAAIRICKHCRQVGGEFASFRDFFWREDEPWVVLQLPSGRKTAVPASWTDLPTSYFSRAQNTTQLLPSALLELVRYCQALRRPQKRVHATTKRVPKRK
jgi:hypothetical protein